MAIKPNYPMVNKGLLYINGCNLSYLTATTLGVSVGQARESNNINDINMTAAVVINSAVRGANGIDAGTIANSTLYAVYVIGNSNKNDPSVDVDASTGGTFLPAAAIISTSFTAPSLPTDYDMYRRIGTVRTNGSAEFLEFTQAGTGSNRDYLYTTPIASNITAGAATSFTAVVLTGIIPTTATRAILKAALTADAGATRTANLISGAASTTARGTATNGQAFISSPASTVTTTTVSCPCSSAPATAVYYVVSNGSAAIALDVAGYTDAL